MKKLFLYLLVIFAGMSQVLSGTIDPNKQFNGDCGEVINCLNSLNGLIAEYPLDGDCMDVSGNGFNGTVVEAVPGFNRFNQINKALSFDGYNDFAILSNSNNLNMGTSARTFSIWAKIKDNGNIQSLFSKAFRQPPFTGYVLHASVTADNQYAQGGYKFDLIENINGQYIQAYSPKQISDSTWHHIVCIYTTGGNLKLYLDGQLDSEVIIGGTPGIYNTDYDVPLEIGNRGHYYDGGAYIVKGLLDEFKVYNRELSAYEIQAIYYYGAGSVIKEERAEKDKLLLSNYPNPFNPVTTINFELSKDSEVLLSVYNSQGELVKTLANGKKNAGKNSVNFDGNGFNSGLFFYKLDVNGKSLVRKMILCK